LRLCTHDASSTGSSKRTDSDARTDTFQHSLDPELTRLVVAWPTLTPAVRTAIVKLATSGKARALGPKGAK
jgi:hypothetical protein